MVSNCSNMKVYLSGIFYFLHLIYYSRLLLFSGQPHEHGSPAVEIAHVTYGRFLNKFQSTIYLDFYLSETFKNDIFCFN